MRGMPTSGRVAHLRPFARCPVARNAVPPSSAAPVGEVLHESGKGINYPSPVLYFTVPPGVYRVSVLGITAGTASYDDGYGTVYPGYPGGLGYRNDLPVTPGEVLTLYVSSPAGFGSQSECKIINAAGMVIFGVQRNGIAYLDTCTAAYLGGAVYGAATPGYFGLDTGSGKSYPQAGFEGTAPYGLGPDGMPGNSGGSKLMPDWPTYGGRSYSYSGAQPLAAGCIRIIWGPGRSFPLNARRLSQ